MPTTDRSRTRPSDLHGPRTAFGAPGPDGAAAGRAGGSRQDGLEVLPSWLRRAVEGWGVRRSRASWVGGVLGGVAEHYRVDPLLARGLFVALCVVSAGTGLTAYAAAWAVLPDADGRVQAGRLRRGEWRDATVAIAVIGALGLLNLMLGAGVTLVAPALGGLGALVGLAVTAALVWCLVTRWDGTHQRRRSAAVVADPTPARTRPEPAWYQRRRPDADESTASAPDAHGFRADWLDPATGTWREPVHSREQRAAARLAEADAAGPAGPAAHPTPRTGSRAVSRRPRLGLLTQALTYLTATGAALATVLLVWLMVGMGPRLALAATVPALLAALAVISAVMLVGLLRGYRPGSLAPVSGVLVAVCAVQTVTAVAALG